MSQTVTVEESVEMAIRRPKQSHTLLAKTLANLINGECWIDRKMKKKFCALFVSNHIDHALEREVDQDLLNRIKNISITRALRFLKKDPEEGLKVLVTLVMQELEHQQKLTKTEQTEFYDEIFGNFFPEISLPSIH